MQIVSGLFRVWRVLPRALRFYGAQDALLGVGHNEVSDFKNVKISRKKRNQARKWEFNQKKK